MTSPLAAGAAVVLLLVTGCRAARTPAPPKGPTTAASEPSLLQTLQQGGTPALKPYLDAYPLAEAGSRSDLVAVDEKRSMHFVQVRRALPRHKHPARTETVYVLTGTGACYVADRSYPIRPGSAFRIAPGVPHAAIPEEGSTIVAVTYFEPPLTEGDDRVVVE